MRFTYVVTTSFQLLLVIGLGGAPYICRLPTGHRARSLTVLLMLLLADICIVTYLCLIAKTK